MSMVLAGGLVVVGAIAWVLISNLSAAADLRQQKVAAGLRRKFGRETPAAAPVDHQKRPRARDFGRR